MGERRDVPRETNQLIIVLAEVAIAVLERRREAEERRAKMALVDGKHRRGKAA